MKETKIAVIGCGNMGRSLTGGLITNGLPTNSVFVADPDPERRGQIHQQYKVAVFEDNADAVSRADVIILAVKPQLMQDIISPLREQIEARNCLVISVAAGIRLSALATWLGDSTAIVRVMPNTPALIQTGASAMYANSRVSAKQKDIAEAIMRSVGLVLWLDDEQMMDAVTALSGSGPAYFFLVMEVLEKAALSLGLTQMQARLLTLETAFGAAKMALESASDAATLRAQVTSPGGTTEQAVNVLLDGNIEELFRSALEAARDKSVELAETLGKS